MRTVALTGPVADHVVTEAMVSGEAAEERVRRASETDRERGDHTQQGLRSITLRIGHKAIVPTCQAEARPVGDTAELAIRRLTLGQDNSLLPAR